MRGKVRLNAGVKAALFNWREEAKRLREENTCHPNAFTTTEFAEEASVSNPTAYRRLCRLEKRGVIRRTRKMVRGKTVEAWVEA